MARIVPTLEQATPSDRTRTIVVVAATIAGLYFGAEIFVPIALAILLSFVLAPAVRVLHKLGLGRTLPVVVAVLLTMLVMAGLGGLIAAQVRDLSNDLPRYESIMMQKLEALRGLSDRGDLQTIEQAVSRFGSALRRQQTGESSGAQIVSGASSAVPLPPPMPVQIVTPALGPIDALLIVAGPLLHPLATGFVVLIFVVFILLQREDLRNRAIRLFGASDLQRTTAAINDGAKRLSRYLLTQCAVNLGTGVTVGLALWMIGVPSPILLGILFACLRFVPYIGPVIGALLPLVLAAAVDPGWSMMLWTAAALLLIEIVVGQLVEPFAYGHNTGLSPIAIIVAATFWTVLWGPVGLLLSTPLTVCLVVLGRHVESLEFLDVLLGDQPPLSPSETLYQRMLANDPVEAADQAQRCLTQMSTAHYLDDVALPALILAQEDAGLDRLDLDRQARIRDTALEVLDDIDPDGDPDHPADDHGFWRFGRATTQAAATETVDLMPGEAPAHLTAPGSVLCVGSRGPLDDAAAAMLAKVLLGHGIGARSESFAKLTKAEIETIDLAPVRLICLSALDGGSAAFLRFVLRRLRRRAPGVPILVGAWWLRRGPHDNDKEIEAMTLPKAATLIDAVRFCLSPGETDGQEAVVPPAPALAS